VTPRVKRKAAEVVAGNNSTALSGADATRYRSVTMRAAYLAQDRPDLGEAVKCRARNMQDPREDHWQELKRLGRYVKQRPRCVQIFRRQRVPNSIHIYVDSDQNRGPIMRKSTTGYVAMFGQHVIKFGSNMQSVIGLSSAEAEHYGLTKGAAIGLGLKSLAEDWFLGIKCEVHFAVYSDSSAALAFASRRGLGTMRHIETRYLWLQERVARGHLTVHKVGTLENVADFLTKAVAGNVLDKHMETLGFVYRVGRSAKAKQVLGASAMEDTPETRSTAQ